FCYVYLLHSNDEASDKFKVFKTEVELQQGFLIKRFKTDKGGEYMDTLYFQSVGIIPKMTAPYNPQQNGIECIFVGYAEYSKAFRFYVIKPNESVSFNSITESKDVIFDENRFSSVPRPSQRSLINETKDIGGLVVPKEVTDKYHKTVDCFGINSQSDYSSDGCEDSILEWKFDESGKGVIICLYVDDMLIKLRIKHESNGIAISQSHYIEKVLKKFNYFDCTPNISVILGLMINQIQHPMDTSEKLMPNNGQAVSQLEYSKVISCLMYSMTCTRPDIAFAVGKLSRYTSNPSTQYWQAIQRILKYLKKTINYSLTYAGYPSVLKGYTDASRISNTKDHSSTSGWIFLLGGAAAGKEAEWLRNLILEISLWSNPIAPISIRCDSATTLEKAYSQLYNGKYRHLGVRNSMIRELIINGVVSIEFVRSKQNLVDHLTKGLARDLVIKSAEGMVLKSN
ncbi:zinc finger, CCHC-type containing protein, partial [Tanacetum coccineum]